MERVPLLLLGVPVVATLAGGFVAIRMDRYRAVLVAVGAGLLLGAAFLDLLPEAILLGSSADLGVRQVLGLTLLFFLMFLGLEGALDIWGHRGDFAGRVQTYEQQVERRQIQGRLAGSLLIFHSFRDGMAIGAAFAASHSAGYAVATGIAAHDFGDGLNTVLLTTGGRRAQWTDYGFLLLDAIAPFLGGLLTIWWILSSRHAAVLLALAAGFFLQMATTDFLPQLRTEKRWILMVGVIGGAGLIWIANWLLGAG